MSEGMPDRRTVPVLTEVIDDGQLVQHVSAASVAPDPDILPDLAEPIIDLSDEGLHLSVSELLAAPPDGETATASATPESSRGEPGGSPELDEAALRLWLAQALERAIPSLVEQLLPELTRLLQAPADADPTRLDRQD